MRHVKIDRRIWLYWEGPLPAYLALCVESVRVANPDAEVALLGRADLDALLAGERVDESIRRAVEGLTPVKRSDFFRAYLLRKFGGLYLDVDCVVLRSLEPAFAAAERSGFAIVHQDDGEPQTNFMVSPASGPAISALFDGICARLRDPRPLAWLDLATVPLVAAIDRHREQVTSLETTLVAPIHWSEPERFFVRGDDESHARQLVPHALAYMLSNDMISSRGDTRHLRARTRDEVLEDDLFLSFLFRRSLGRSKPSCARPVRMNALQGVAHADSSVTLSPA